MLDKWAFTMSKIDGEESKSGSYTNSTAAGPAVNGTDAGARKDAPDELAIAAGNISLEPNTFGAKSATPLPANPPGPSLLTQQAPSHSQVLSTSTSSTLNSTQWSSSTSSMTPSEVDPRSIQSTSSTFEGNERITVKIADLGNGVCARFPGGMYLTMLQPHGRNITSRMTSRPGSIAVQRSSSARNGVRVRIFGASPAWLVVRSPQPSVNGGSNVYTELPHIPDVNAPLHVQIFELITGGDYLFDPASGSRYSKDDDHIAQIMELMGDVPKSVLVAGRHSSEFFNRKSPPQLISF
jgi:serine/threonine-protein kinase SRPK3